MRWLPLQTSAINVGMLTTGSHAELPDGFIIEAIGDNRTIIDISDLSANMYIYIPEYDMKRLQGKWVE